MSRVVLHTDGGARGNPGPAAIGVVIELERDGRLELVEEIAETIGVATNNVAEYRALIRGLEEARRRGATEVTCLLDSQLVVEQLRGRYKVKHANVISLHQQAEGLARQFQKAAFRYVPRAENTEADRLVNAALDRRPVGGVGPVTPPATGAILDDARRGAIELVREAYYTAANMVGSDLEAINRSRPPGMRYRSERRLIHEFLLMAGAVSTFAVQVGLIEQDDLTAFLKEFWAEQPDLIAEADESWIQQNFDLTATATE